MFSFSYILWHKNKTCYGLALGSFMWFSPSFSGGVISVMSKPDIRTLTWQNQQNTNNVGDGQMLYVSFTLYGDNYWISSPIPCDQADKRTIALADNVKNPSADVNSAVSSGLFTVMKTKDAFYLITNDTAVAGYIFGTLHPNRMWLVTYNVG